MKILSNKEFEDYKKAKKELHAITAHYLLNRSCESFYCTRAEATAYGIERGDISSSIINLMSKYFNLKIQLDEFEKTHVKK